MLYNIKRKCQKFCRYIDIKKNWVCLLLLWFIPVISFAWYILFFDGLTYNPFTINMNDKIIKYTTGFILICLIQIVKTKTEWKAILYVSLLIGILYLIDVPSYITLSMYIVFILFSPLYCTLYQAYIHNRDRERSDIKEILDLSDKQITDLGFTREELRKMLGE